MGFSTLCAIPLIVFYKCSWDKKFIKKIENLLVTEKLPFSIRVLLESAVRNCDQFQVHKADVEKILDWQKNQHSDVEIPFKPARVILQDFT